MSRWADHIMAGFSRTFWPSSDPRVGHSPVGSTAPGSSLILKPTGGNLYKLNTIIGATPGFLLLFDATSVPGDGAVTPLWAAMVTSNGTNGELLLDWGDYPMVFLNGIVAVFSTTGPFNKTANATASFFGAVK